MTENEIWPREWQRGVLEPCLLGILIAGPSYGYQIAQRLEDGGLGIIKGGTLYPVLGRMETSGLLTTSWHAGDGGPGRKYYELTEHGIERARQNSTLWNQFSATVGAILAPEQPPKGAQDER